MPATYQIFWTNCTQCEHSSTVQNQSLLILLHLFKDSSQTEHHKQLILLNLYAPFLCVQSSSSVAPRPLKNLWFNLSSLVTRSISPLRQGLSFFSPAFSTVNGQGEGSCKKYHGWDWSGYSQISGLIFVTVHEKNRYSCIFLRKLGFNRTGKY